MRHGHVVSLWKMSPSLLTKDNNNKELKYNQTQPNSTEPKIFRSGQSNRSGVEVRPTVGGSLSADINQQSPSVQKTFEMEVKGSEGPGAAGREHDLPMLLTQRELRVQLATADINKRAVTLPV